MVAWLVLIVSTLILLGFLTFLGINNWQVLALSIVITALLFCAIYGLAWSLYDLFGWNLGE